MKRGLFVVLFLLAFLPAVSGEVLVGQPEEIYNVGDELSVDVTINPSNAVNDFLEVDIICSNGGIVQIYRNPFNLNGGEEVTINVIAFLTTSLIGSLEGQCNLGTSYGEDNAISQGFELTRQINIELELSGNRYDPGNDIGITGFALKKNGELVNGFVEVSIPSLGVLTSKVVSEGVFSFNFTLSDDAIPGEHVLSVRIYEEDNSGFVGNEGLLNEIIIVSQILTKLDILVNSQNIFPGETLSYTINAEDQAGGLIERGDISLKIYEPGDFLFSSKVIESGLQEGLELESDFVPGYWKIEVESEALRTRKLFYVEEVPEIQTSLIDDTLVVTNIGNVRYQGPIQITIGSATEVQQVDLKVGETRQFKLSAPEGTYSIGIDDGKEQVDLGNTFLTGNAIGVSEIGGGLINTLTKPLIWGLAVFLLILIVAYVAIRRSGGIKKLVTKKPKVEKISSTAGLEKKKEDNKKGNVVVASVPAAKEKAVMYGTKEDVSFIAIKEDHGNSKAPYISSTVNRALMAAKGAGAKVYVEGNYKIILFAPSITKSKENDVIAVRAAKKIEDIFNDHNTRFKGKINFGIGVNRGQIISERKGSEFTFTTVGTVLSKAKNIAQSMGKETLLSDNSRRSVVNQIKTEQVKGKDLWKIVKIADRGQHESFLSRFKKK